MWKDDPSVRDGADEIAVTEDDVDDDARTSTITLDDDNSLDREPNEEDLLILATYNATVRRQNSHTKKGVRVVAERS